LEIKDDFVDGANHHMFDDKKARFDTMNSLASYSFQMYEAKCQKAPSDKVTEEQLQH
jgi:hypothetical protein